MEGIRKRRRKCKVPKQATDILHNGLTELGVVEDPQENRRDYNKLMPSKKGIRRNVSSTYIKAATTSLVRNVFENYFRGQIEANTMNNSYPKMNCGICQSCQLPDCGLCINCKKMKKFGGTGKTKYCKRKRCENSLVHIKSPKYDQNQLRDKLLHLEDCSKQMLRSTKWLKKSSLEYNGNQGYSAASVDDIIVRQGDFVMLHGEAENEPLRIAKVTYMYDSPVEGQMFHAHFFCRGTDTILGGTADPRELFVVDDCDDHMLGCILQKTKVEFRNTSKNWAYLGGRVNLPKKFQDNGTHYFFSKIYDYEFSKFRDYNEDIMEPNDYCFSCKWQLDIKNNETPIYKDNCILWHKEIYKIGSAVFLEPGQSKYIPIPVSEIEENNTDNKLCTEVYRKKSDISQNSNLYISQPFTVGIIEDIQNGGKKIKVRMFYRPEDTKISLFLSYLEDLNYLYWSDHVIWTPFKNVKGKCNVKLFNEKKKAQEWSKKGPFRFYFLEAYDYKNHEKCEVPEIVRRSFNHNIENEKYRLRSNRNHTSQNVTREKPPKWEQLEKPLKCMDIYAGCGGLSEGLHQAAVAETLWAIEKEKAPARAFQANNLQCLVYVDDCNNILKTLLSGKGKRMHLPEKGDVELLIGGPPCQGFSGMNRFNKGKSSCFKNSQITTFLSFCDYYRPKYLIFENVRNFVSFRKGIILKLTLRCLLGMGYQISFGILQAGSFGIPQTRRRFILIGAAPGYPLPNLPEPLHVFSRPRNFLSIIIDGLKYDTGSNWTASLPYRPICVRDAIADLPDIKNGSMKRTLPYYGDAKSYFQKSMRKTNKTDHVTDHICKKMCPIVEARISHIPPLPSGGDWRDLPNKVVKLRDGSMTKILKYPYKKKNQKETDLPRGVCKCATGRACDPSDRQLKTLIPWSLSHTADRHNNWPSVYGRLRWDDYFGTTVTNPEPMGTQGKVLHPEENRVVSVRECARSQGFQDEYKFCGNILDKHRQIGNAVPPPLGLALGREIIKAYKNSTIF